MPTCPLSPGPAQLQRAKLDRKLMGPQHIYQVRPIAVLHGQAERDHTRSIARRVMAICGGDYPTKLWL